MADTKISALTAASAAAAANEFAINEAGSSKKLSLSQIADYFFKRINGSSGAAGEYKTLQKLSSNSSDNSSATPAVVMTTTGVGTGTWHFKYNLIYQSGATTTGIGFSVNHTGTPGQFSMMWLHITTGGTAATGVGDGATATTAGQMAEGKAERAINTISSSTAGVDTQNEDIHAILEGIVVITASGNLELKMASENTTAVRIMADSCLELTKIG